MIYEWVRRLGVGVRIAVDVVVAVAQHNPPDVTHPVALPVIVDRVMRIVGPVESASNPMLLLAIVEFRTMMLNVEALETA